MISRTIAFLTSASMILLFSSVALACFITFDPETVQANSAGRAEFDAVIRWEHRKCVLDDDDVNLDATGLKVLSQTGWEQVKRGLFKNHIAVELTSNEGTLRVWRDCSKKGISEQTIRVTR